MKNCIYALLCIAVILPVSLYGQTIVNVKSDDASGGNLNRAIAAAIASNTLSTTVFQLEAAGYYLLTGPVTTPAGTTLTITAPDPGNTPATALPMIMALAGGGVTWLYNFDVFGDISLKNIWLMYASTTPAQLGQMALEIDNDSTRNKNIANFENVIFEYSSEGCVESRTTNLIASFKNCYFRNCIDQHLRYYGRALTWPFQTTTWHTDSVSFVNCTFANMGYGFMQESPEWSEHVWFNHCTFLNIMMFPIESSYWDWLNLNNSLFVNAFMYGDIRSGRGAVTSFPNGGALNIDTLKTTGFNFNFTESQRHILFTHCAYYLEDWLTSYIANNPFSLDPATTDDLRPFPQPMVSTKTMSFFNDKTKWPYMSTINSTLIDSVNPGFLFAPTNEDAIKTFLLGRWSTSTNIDWAYDITSDLNGTWPMNEDLSYSNSQLKTAGMGGFPLGDLYHWWPTQYTAWKAQEQAENDTIYKWLSEGINGGITGVKEQSIIPAHYELNQNYPNPFNPTTNISFALPEKSFVSLKVFNILGEEITELAGKEYSAGQHTIRFDATNIASGVYFYTIKAGKFTSTQKMVFQK
ncbi:MAG: T9SS type A sorting domain-containing protein [Bacteroidota bacterium]|jgi:hypothetical protein